MKKAYLTIDDAPSRDFAAKLEFLYQKDIPALFFCEGRYIKQREDLLCAAIQHGFVIGNHAFDHPYFSDIPLEQCKWQIKKTDELIEHLYQRAELERSARYFRFPYFDSGGSVSGSAHETAWNQPASEPIRVEHKEKHREIQQYLRDLGYRQPNFEGVNPKYFTDPTLLTRVDVRCTFNQAEYWLGKADAPWGFSTEAAILRRIDEDFPYEGRSLNCVDTADIILVHDHEYTTALFYRIIERYLEKGIQFMPIPGPGM